MKRSFAGILAVVALALSLPAPVGAQQKFVPFELDQNSAQAIYGALGEVPAKYAISVLSILDREENLAQQRAAIEAAKAAKPIAPSPTPSSTK